MSFGGELVDAACGRKRVKRPQIWRAFQCAHPVEATAGDARERLMSRLRALAADGRIELPSEHGSSWDRTARPAIPEWVSLVARPTPEPSLDVAAIPWAPELAFVAMTPGLAHLDEALAIHQFLSSGGRCRPLVPMRERSVELFGDEKRLERLVRTPLFGEGRLDAGTLRCFAMAPPLVFEAGPPGTEGRPSLVLENHHTWWSFCRWNERRGEYCAVIYGAGSGFGREAVSFLHEHCQVWGTDVVEYFGDVDRDGLAIPWRAATRFAPSDGVRLVAAARWYTLLLERAEGVSLPCGPAIVVEDEVLRWLPCDLRAHVQGWLDRGVRLPQELVGTEQLLAFGLR